MSTFLTTKYGPLSVRWPAPTTLPVERLTECAQRTAQGVVCLQGSTPSSVLMTMSGKAEEVKGRVKESAGVLTNNPNLKDEGRADQASGKVKQAVTRIVDKVKNAVKGKKA